jgi:anti-sigma regulatory factor (Ser/Thr protein kinase)
VSRSRSGSDQERVDVFLELAEPNQVGEARRTITALARKLGFDEEGCGKVALVVSEAASNVIKHTRGGEVMAQAVDLAGELELELLVLDSGPGMADPSRCLRDGYSTGGTPGTGMGAISRLASSFELYSLPSTGTVLWIRFRCKAASGGGPARNPGARDGGLLDVAALQRPKPGEAVCGDGWAVEEGPGLYSLMVADGLGHGPLAAEAAREAVRVLRERSAFEPGEILHRTHGALRSTRGAAIGIASLNLAKRSLRFAGVGNIAGTIYANGSSQSLVSQNGTVGHEMRRIQEFEYQFPPGALLVMHSDGLSTHWRLDRYAGLANQNLALITGALYRDFKRGRDDVTILTARERDENGP